MKGKKQNGQSSKAVNRIHVRVDGELLEWLQAVATSRHYTLSQAVRDLIWSAYDGARTGTTQKTA